MPEEDTEWDLEGSDGDAMEDFEIRPPRGSARQRRREEEECMEGVRRVVLGGVHVEEPQHGHLDFKEAKDVAAVGNHRGRQWDPRWTSRPAFMVSKAADDTVWEDQKDITHPMYDGNPPNLDPFLEKLDDCGLTVTEDMDPAAAEKYVFKRFPWHLPGLLQKLYFMAAKEGDDYNPNRGQEVAQKQERVEAPQVAAKGWRAIKLQHDGQEIRLPDWRDLRGQYVLLRRSVED